MVRFVALALAVASASAFVPASTQVKESALNVIPPEREIGVLPPVGFFE